ncbi:CidA/LrgA family protein [Thiomicrorhabdus sp. zzn3]|uniref:CidA/LrgA family protein n=1 Tax=Thiomicrorhabdus sp. zzn3 TaxID=3039775 RepID=UPI002436A6D8|nr:CidA/LrgA family protein [Thiomicrorhabdus sp. zzn3]MDG6778108.1 CidA/LrgA family protein [Thiomicrorhabdus sp. zzn3]
MSFLSVITLLLVYQLIGELIVLQLALPVPGPVIGMLLLLLTLLFKKPLALKMEPTAQQFLAHLSLLFIPAGVGVMVHWERLQTEWLAILLALLISTILGLLVTAGIMLLLMRCSGHSPSQPDSKETP